MNWIFYIATSFLCVSFLSAQTRAEPSFDNYKVILDRKPFGNPPPPPAEPTPAPRVVPPGESFARQIKLCAFIEEEDGTIQVGLMNTQTKDNFYLKIGDINEGIELVSANYDEESAVLKKGDELAVLSFQTGDVQPITQEEAQSHIERGRTGYAARRQAREEARKRRQEAIEQQAKEEPALTGEALEKHLQEYQMEVIRQGLPPLPIPLTEEMDAQLVAEGLLDPIDEEAEAATY